MKRLLTITTVLALAAARPETYKETEDFNYQRSSTDEGSKTGFYNSQRGNMGGNYERAHNMDGLAQHQMSSAVNQVEGELGEASKMKSGQVFTSAQSGGMFGSGHYDVSNLQGRNFHENSYDAANSQSHSSLSSHQSAFNDHLSSSIHNSAYNGLAHNSGSGYDVYQGTKTGQSLHSSDLQAIDDVHGANYGYGTHGANSHSSGVASQSGYHSQNMYDNSNANQFSTHGAYGAVPQNRLIYTAPVRVYGRPGSRVAVPVGVQTYDATHSASTLDHNAINTEAEVLNTDDQHVVGYKPTGNAKHYESSYNYRKQWEKHNVQPEVIALAIPTESPFPINSELYEDAQLSNNQYHASGLNSHSGYSSSMHDTHNSNVKSLSASQLHQSTIDSQQAASVSNSNTQTHGAYNSGNSADTANVLGGIDTKPKSYQSSYSYHKAWERQGDPYVIKPVNGAYTNLDSQSLTGASNHQGYSHQSGSNYQKTHQGYTQGNGLQDCDVNGFRRVARSVRNLRGNDDLTQQSQTSWSNIEDLGQQTQNSWDRSDALRQAQNHQNAQVQQNQWDNSEDLGQQTQNSWDRSDALRQAHNHQNAQVQQNQWDNTEDLGQQTQNSWDRSDALRQAHNHQNAQVQQNQWDNTEDLGQQTQKSWDRSDALRQAHNQQNIQVQQQTQQNKLGKLEDLEDLTQQTQQQKWDSQRHSGQAIANAWPGYVSEPEKPEKQTKTEYDYEHQDQEKKEMPEVGSTSFNQEQQSQSNPWADLDQQEIQPGSSYLKYPGHKETEQQANIDWGEYLDQQKFNNQQQEEKLPQTPLWPSNDNRPSSNHYNQEVYHQADSGSFDLYDWSKASADKTGGEFSQLGSLWDKLSAVDGQFSATNFHVGKEYQNSNVNVNQGKYYEREHNTILTSTVTPAMSDFPTYEQNQPTRGTPKINHNSGQDIGRGDIGPEEDFVEQNSPNFEDSKPVSLAKEMKNISQTTSDHVTKVHYNEKTLNEWFEEERRNNQFNNLNSSQHSSWKQEHYYSGNSKNQTTLHSSHQYGLSNEKARSDSNNYSHIRDKNYTNNVEQIHELTVNNQEFVPTNQWTKSSNESQKSSEKIMPQNSSQIPEFEPVEIQQHQKNQFKVDVAEFENIDQNLDQQWQQAQKLNDNETFWGQSVQSYLQMPQFQEKAETFGLRIKDDQQNTSTEITLAEKFKRESEELDDIYRSNQNLPHYNKNESSQLQAHLHSTETSNIMQDKQTTQNSSIPLELTTEKPGLYTRFKNKFMSLFSKKDK